jgi:hypothetical protein
VRTLDVLSAAIGSLTRLNAGAASAGGGNHHQSHGGKDNRNRFTLLDVPRVLSDPSVRRQVVGQLDDEVLLGFWAGFEVHSPRQTAEVVAPAMRRLRQFLASPSLRGVLGQAEPGFDLGQVFRADQPLAVLVPLNKALLGEQTAQLFGSLVVARLWQETLGRAALPVAQRRPVSVILDEAPDLLRLPLSLGDALAQARGYGVGFTVAAQFRSQWPPALREAIDANTLSKVCFRQPAGDARAMAVISGGQVGAEDFMALDQYQVYASLAHAGHPGDWFSARTLPPPPATSRPGELRQISRERYGQPVVKPSQASDGADGETPQTEALGRKRRAAL